MRKLFTLLALGAAMSFCGVASAANADRPLKGKITSIKPDDDKMSTDLVIVSGKEKTEVTVKVDETAAITVDGNTAKLVDLTVGERVTITPATGKVTSIAAVTKGKKKDATVATPAAPAPAPAK